MRLIRPSYQILTDINGGEILKRIERAGRTCYQSEEKIDDGTAEKFVGMIIKRGHESVLEHESISVKFIVDRGISHELVRHRLASFCMSKDTKISRFSSKKDITIEELFRMQYANYRYNGKIKMLLLRSIDKDNIIIPNKVKNVIYSGVQDVYEIKTRLGYNIKTTQEHVFITINGDKKLKDLRVGDDIFVNGVELFKDREWLYEKYHQNNCSLSYMAKLANCHYSTIRKYLRHYKLTKKLGTKPDDFTPWNKGLKESDDIRVKKQANALREHHHNGESGPKSSSWKGGVSYSYYSKLKSDIDYCESCGCKNIEIEYHHIDKNRKNNQEDNLIKVCVKCHNTIHKHKTKKVLNDKIVSIKYVGNDEVYDIEMFEPHHNVIANGIVVHNSQESTRYCDYGSKHVSFIIPPWEGIEEGVYSHS